MLQKESPLCPMSTEQPGLERPRTFGNISLTGIPKGCTPLNFSTTSKDTQNVTNGVSTSRILDSSKRLRQSEERAEARTSSKPRSASVTVTMTTSIDSITGRYTEANTVIGSGLTTDMMSADSTEELSVAELDTILTYTCKDRCGQDMPFPCSCAAICVVYNTCCENITLDCQHIVQEGLASFDYLVNTDKVCSENYVYIIASCPEQEDNSIMRDKSDFSGILDSEKQGLGKSKRNDSWEDEQMKNVQDQNITPPLLVSLTKERKRGLRWLTGYMPHFSLYLSLTDTQASRSLTKQSTTATTCQKAAPYLGPST